MNTLNFIKVYMQSRIRFELDADHFGRRSYLKAQIRIILGDAIPAGSNSDV